LAAVASRKTTTTASSLAADRRYRVASESDTDDEEVHTLKDNQKEEMERLMAKHEAELRMLKEKRQKKKQAQLASFNKQLQQQDNVKNSPQRDSKLPRDGPT